MIVIVRHYKFDEEPTTFDKLGVGSLYIIENQMYLGNAIPINMKIAGIDGLNGYNAVSCDTGNCFRMASSTIVYKGKGQEQ